MQGPKVCFDKMHQATWVGSGWDTSRWAGVARPWFRQGPWERVLPLCWLLPRLSSLSFGHRDTQVEQELLDKTLGR